MKEYHLKSDPVHVSWASGPVLRVSPGREGRHHDLEVHVCGPGVLHRDVPEGDGVPARAMPPAPQTEHSSSHVVVKLTRLEIL